jgi:hypothetical protein
MALYTPKTAIGRVWVYPQCKACRRYGHKTLDLADLVRRGFGDTPLSKLPLRCTGCQSRAWGYVLSGVPPGYAERAAGHR